MFYERAFYERAFYERVSYERAFYESAFYERAPPYATEIHERVCAPSSGRARKFEDSRAAEQREQREEVVYYVLEREERAREQSGYL